MKKLAIYDLDDTLLCGDSEFHWAKFTVEKGYIEEEVYLKKNQNLQRKKVYLIYLLLKQR